MIILTLTLLFFLLYTIIPTFLIRKWSWRIYKKGNKTNHIAITFDDGPDPVYTPPLLDLLDRYQVNATFFVVGEKAEKFPDIIREIKRRGHLIGVHNYYHISNWLLPPLLLKRHLVRSQLAIEKITGEKPLFYRPPWGHFNLFTPFSASSFYTVMWTSIPGDWNEKLGSKKLAERLRKARVDGAVITLHDSGTTLGADLHAPKHMLAALEDMLNDKESRQFQYVTVADLFNLKHRKGQAWRHKY